jgi:hypothetical protein
MEEKAVEILQHQLDTLKNELQGTKCEDFDLSALPDAQISEISNILQQPSLSTADVWYLEDSLVHAAQLGDIKAVEKLLDSKKVDINAERSYSANEKRTGGTALTWAGEFHKNTMIKYLLLRGASASKCDGTYNLPAVAWARSEYNEPVSLREQTYKLLEIGEKIENIEKTLNLAKQKLRHKQQQQQEQQKHEKQQQDRRHQHNQESQPEQAQPTISPHSVEQSKDMDHSQFTETSQHQGTEHSQPAEHPPSKEQLQPTVESQKHPTQLNAHPPSPPQKRKQRAQPAMSKRQRQQKRLSSDLNGAYWGRP